MDVRLVREEALATLACAGWNPLGPRGRSLPTCVPCPTVVSAVFCGRCDLGSILLTQGMLCGIRHSSPPQSSHTAPDPTGPLAASSGPSPHLAGHPQPLTQPRETLRNARWLPLAVYTTEEVRRARKCRPQGLGSLACLSCFSALPSDVLSLSSRTALAFHLKPREDNTPSLVVSFPTLFSYDLQGPEGEGFFVVVMVLFFF